LGAVFVGDGGCLLAIIKHTRFAYQQRAPAAVCLMIFLQ
jgi:hypothetical protein